MKAEHRHELKTNELAEWLVNLPEWTKQNYKTITYVAAGVLIVIVGAILFRYKNTAAADKKALDFTASLVQLPFHRMQIIQAQVTGVDQSYTLKPVADSFQSIAQTASSAEMAAFALIQKGDIIRTELHFKSGPVSEQDIATAIENSKTAYNEALAKTKNPLFIGRAKMALGLCEEELGNFDNARAIYQQIASDPNFDAVPVKAAANMRLKTMADYRETPYLAPSPVQPPVETLQPQIELPPVDLNLPATP